MQQPTNKVVKKCKKAYITINYHFSQAISEWQAQFSQ